MLATYCVREPHAMPFLRNKMPYLLQKLPKTHVTYGKSIIAPFYWTFLPLFCYTALKSLFSRITPEKKEKVINWYFQHFFPLEPHDHFQVLIPQNFSYRSFYYLTFEITEAVARISFNNVADLSPDSNTGVLQ